MSSGQGSISIDNNGSGSGSQAALASTGAGIPVFVGPASIKSLVEETGIQLDDIGPGLAIGIKNRLLFFFVTQYGATGNGTTDDTAAIQAAFTACGTAGGGVVFFPKGDYKISATITWPAGATIRAIGVNGGDVIQNGTIEGCSTIIMTAQITAFATSGELDRIENLQFVGTVGATAGAFVNSSSFNFEAINCGFYGGFDGIVLTRNQNTRIVRCGFRELNDNAIALSNSVSPDDGDATIMDCAFTCSTATTQAGIFQSGSGGTKVISCKFVSAGNMVYCIHSTFGAGLSTSDLLVCNCSLELFKTAGILVTASAGAFFENVVVVGNNISSYAGGQGITLNGTGSGAFRDMTITGNAINNCTIGINMASATNVNIVGNAFSLNTTQDVARSGTTVVNTGFAGDDNGATPVTPGTPAKWSAVTLYTSTGPVVYKVPLYL